MTGPCPNAHDNLDGQCGGRQLIEHRSQLIPCPTCWVASNRAPLTTWQQSALRGALVFLEELLDAVEVDGQAPLDVTGLSDQFDRWCGEVRRRGVDDHVRDVWLAWVRNRTTQAVAA